MRDIVLEEAESVVSSLCDLVFELIAEAVAVAVRPRCFEFNRTLETDCAGRPAQGVVSSKRTTTIPRRPRVRAAADLIARYVIKMLRNPRGLSDLKISNRR